MILIKAGTKHLQVFYLEYQNLEDLYIFQFHLIPGNVDRVYDIVPIERHRKKTELSKDTQEMKKLNYLKTFKGCYMSTKD